MIQPCKKCNKATYHKFKRSSDHDLPLCPVCLGDYYDYRQKYKKLTIDQFLSLSYNQLHVLCFKEPIKRAVKVDKNQTNLF